MNALRMAVVGTGALGRHHARILSEMAGVKLVAVVDTNQAAGVAVAEKCGTAWIGDYRDLPDRGVGAVVVAVPTLAHHAVAGDLLREGLDVLVEKPIAADLEQARELAALAHTQGAILQVGHVERFNPALIAARPHLATPKYIRAERYSPYSFRSTDIGVVHDMMIHDIDLVLSLVHEPVERVEALGVSIMGGQEDCVQARLTFAGGCVADLSANRVSPVTRRDMQVWSAEGCAHLDFGAREAVLYLPSPTLRYGVPPLERARQPGTNIEQLRAEVFGTYVKVHRPTVTPRDQLTEELLAFTDSIRTRQAPLVGGAEAVEAMEIAHAILDRVAASAWNSQVAEAARNPRIRKLAG